MLHEDNCVFLIVDIWKWNLQGEEWASMIIFYCGITNVTYIYIYIYIYI